MRGSSWKALAVPYLALVGIGVLLMPVVSPEKMASPGDWGLVLTLGPALLGLATLWSGHVPGAWYRIRLNEALKPGAPRRALCRLGWHRASAWGRSVFFRELSQRGDGALVYAVNSSPREEGVGSG